MSCHRCFERQGGRLRVTDFAHQNDVRILTNNRAENIGEVEFQVAVDLDLRGEVEIVFDRVLNGDNVACMVSALDGVESGVKRRRLASPGRSGNKNEATGAVKHLLDECGNRIREYEIAQIHEIRIRCNDAQDQFLTAVTGCCRNAELDPLVVGADYKPTVLGAANAGDVQVGHDFDAGDQLLKVPSGNLCSDRKHPAVNPQPNPASFGKRFNMYIACTRADGGRRAVQAGRRPHPSELLRPIPRQN